MGMAATFLADGRLQVWQGGGRTSWQTRRNDPESYTPWVAATEENLGALIDVAAMMVGSDSAGVGIKTHVWGARSDSLPYARKATTHPDAGWVGGDFLREVPLPQDLRTARLVTAAAQPSGAQRLWLLAESGAGGGHILSTAKTDPRNVNSRWEPWARWNPPAGPVRALAAATLAEGGEQLWFASLSGIHTTYRTSPSGPWSAWSRWDSPGGQQASDLAAARLPDGRLQLWVVSGFGASARLYTTWQVRNGSSLSWSSWDAELDAPGGERPSEVGAAAMPDRRLQLWTQAGPGRIYTTWKVSAHPDAGWESWRRVS